MKLINRFKLSLANIYPKKARLKVKRLLNYAGIKLNERIFLGNGLIISLVLITGLIIIDYLRSGLSFITFLISIGLLFGVQGLMILIPYFKSEQRSKKLESVLPDFLNLMAANMRSGMTPLSSMMAAAKEDFEVLSEEVEDAIAVSMGSESYENILKLLNENVNSTILERIVKLLITGMRTGGNMANLLEGAAEEVIQMNILKNELITSVRSYMIFIMIIVVAGLPFLLTVSTYFVQTIQSLQGLTTDTSLSPAMATSQITVEFLNIISYVVLIGTSFFGSMLIGSVIDDSYVQGLKYFVPFVALSITVYLIASSIIPNLVGSINL